MRERLIKTEEGSRERGAARARCGVCVVPRANVGQTRERDLSVPANGDSDASDPRVAAGAHSEMYTVHAS